MRRSFCIPLLLWFLGICNFITFAYCSQGDSIRPISKINKEFLIVVHIVHDKTNSPVDKSSITAAIASMNTVFEPIGASFRICEYRDIYNFTYDTLSEKYDPEMMVKYRIQNRINVFLVSDFPDRPNVCGYASLGGISSGSGTSIVIKKGCATVSTMSHEMGHFFGLPHTFEGSGSENADGSNCSDHGDGICDTPADPYVDGSDIFGYIDNNCTFTYTGKDANGDYYNPDVSNIMSYYSPCRCIKFTQGQYEKMAAHYLNSPVMW